MYKVELATTKKHFIRDGKRTIFQGVGRYLDLQTAFRNRDAGDIVAPPFEDLRFMFMCTPLNSCFILGAPVDELNRWMLLPYGTYYLAREHQDAVVIGNQNNSPFDKERMVCAQHGLYYSPEVDGSYNGILVRVRECFVKVSTRQHLFFKFPYLTNKTSAFFFSFSTITVVPFIQRDLKPIF